MNQHLSCFVTTVVKCKVGAEVAVDNLPAERAASDNGSRSCLVLWPTLTTRNNPIKCSQHSTRGRACNPQIRPAKQKPKRTNRKSTGTPDGTGKNSQLPANQFRSHSLPAVDALRNATTSTRLPPRRAVILGKLRDEPEPNLPTG